MIAELLLAVLLLSNRSSARSGANVNTPATQRKPAVRQHGQGRRTVTTHKS